MSNTIRITSAGNFYANSFDEVTFNSNSGYTKNLFQYSTDLTNTYWNNYNETSVLTNATLAPDGTNTAFLVTSTGTGTLYPNTRPNQFLTVLPNTYYTLSSYVKYGNTAQCTIGNENGSSAIASFDLTNGTNTNLAYNASNPIIKSVGNGWWRISVTIYTANYNYMDPEPFWIGNYGGQNTGEYMYCWGPQLELGQVATIYEPTSVNARPTSKSISKIDSNGNNYITGQFDEVSGLSVTDGLTFYLDAKIYDSSTYSRNTWSDLSPKNVQVTLKNVGYNSANGGYFTFQGNSTTDYYINTNLTESSFISPSAGTISVWFLPTGASPNMGGSSYTGQHIWGETDFFGNSDDYIWIVRGIRNGVDAIYCGLWDNTNEHFVSVPYTANQWINITWLHTNNTLYAYSNGQLVGSVTANNSSNASLTTIIGGCPGHLPGLSGYIGKVQSYNRALSPTEIQINYNADAARFNLTRIGPQAVQRILPTGNTYITGIYDEWTGVPVVDSSLVLWLDAGQPASSNGLSTIWTDLSGNSYNAINNYYINPPVPLGANGLSPYDPIYGAYYFNNVVNNPIQPNCYDGFYINQNSSNNQLAKMLTNSFTFEIWVKHTAWNNIIYGGYPLTQDNSYGLWEQYNTTGYRFGSSASSLTGQGQPTFYTIQSGGTLNLSAGQNIINLNQWYNITVTFNTTSGNSGTGSMYVNGVLYNTATGTYYPSTSGSTSDFSIGGNAEGCGSFTGEMSVYKWYSRSLSASEVNTNFNALRNRYGI